MSVPELEIKQNDELAAARELIAQGLPVFMARRTPEYTDGAPEFHLPKKWPDTKPNLEVLAEWRRGDALCLVAGHGLDIVDVDTKNGAEVDEQRERLRGCGVTVLAEVSTPSGGAHFYVRSAGICSAASTSVGVDFRGRGADNSGSGFVYLPGTLRPKYQGKGYEWLQSLDPEDLYDVDPEEVEEQGDAVSVYLAALGIKVRTGKEPEGETVTGEPLDFLPEALRRELENAGPWPKSYGSSPTDRSVRFMNLVGRCRREGLTQGQAVTALAPWCDLTGKYLGRVPEEVARVWPKVKPTDQAVSEWLQSLDPEDLYDVHPEMVEEQGDAVSVYLAGLGIKVRTGKEPEGETVTGEPLDFLPEALGRALTDAGPWPKSDGSSSTDRSGRFMYLVGECCRTGLTQGQAVTALAPWCDLTGKYRGRVPKEVARVWPKVKPTDQAVSEWLQDSETPPGGQEQDSPEGPSSWSPVDLGPFLDGSHVQERAQLLPRSDGQGLLYAGRLHSFHGESESGKSLIAQAEAARVLSSGGRVLYVDFESDPSTVTGRLLSLGATQDQIGAGLDYLMPEEGLTTGRALIAFNAVLERSYVLAVLDGVTEALNLVTAGGGKPEEQIAQYVRVLPRRIARDTGAAVVQIDHVTKSTEGRGRYALGSQHKMNTLDGAAYLVEVSAPIGPNLRGVLVLRIGKDRPGNIRGNSAPYRLSDRTQEAARLVFDGTREPGRTFVTVEPPRDKLGQDGEDRAFRPTGLMEKVSKRLERSQEPLSQKDATIDLGRKAEHARTALGLLIKEGYVTKETGPRGAHLHKSLRPYRQDQDPASDTYSERDELDD